MKKIIALTSIIVILAVIISGGTIFATAKSVDDIKTDFLNQSETNATAFIQSDYLSNGDWDYVTYVSENTDSSKSEMYLIRNTDFLFLNHLNRFKIVDHFVGNDNSIIDYDYSKIDIQNKEKKVFFAYSSNNSHISKIECEFSGASGNIQFEKLGVSSGMPFAVEVTLRENDMELTAIKCLGVNGEILFSYGEFLTV